jgi:SAM-dependent methyltransferase
MTNSVGQKDHFEQQYGVRDASYWSFHDTKDPLIRYLRDRRLQIAIDHVLRTIRRAASELDVLVVCGGVGGEGTFLANAGFRSVTVSDFSQSALDFCRARDPRLLTRLLDAEQLALPADSYDLVLVQDGLHHLPRPTLGFTEMLRVARIAAIVIEPHTGVVARLLGTKWETEGDAVNWVFRWNADTLTQITNSYYPAARCSVIPIRIWDHNVVMGKVARVFGGHTIGLAVVRLLYGALNVSLGWAGNMMIGIVFKADEQPAGSEH